jgi:signal transduction histidine kinase/CheY-like chemotaxis protein
MISIEEDIIGLLVNNEDWLMSRILEYAKKHEYSKYTSTLHEAWRMSINGLTESIVLAIKTYGIKPPELHPDDKYDIDPVSAFGVSQAQKHRKRGVTLSMFLGLMKYYRQSYIELIEKSPIKTNEKCNIGLFINRCFDRIEIGYITEWNEKPNEDIVNELQYSNRDMTNEKNKYLTVFESFFAPIILLDDQNKIINFNLAASKLFTNIYLSGEFYYKNQSSEFFSIEFKDKIDQLTGSSDADLSYETYLETNSGKRFFQVLLKKMLDVSDKFKGTVIMLNDLTQRKEIEQHLQNAKSKAEEADRLKTSFLANMSHEIRTPMNAIMGFTELLQTTNPDKKERSEFLKLIRTSSNDLLNIIEDLIDIAKIESKQFKIKFKECRPYTIITDLQIVFHEVLKRYGIQDTVELLIKVDEPDKDIVFYSDGERLKQVLNNLLNNAAKFTDNGFIEFGYKIIDHSNIFFFVRDSGPGIPDSMKDKIFERFTQLETQKIKDHRGAGLGLAICKNIVNLLGGEIWVESTPGKGSDFLFQLPMREVPANIERDSDKVPAQKILARRDWIERKILIAEDDESNFLYLSETLRSTGAKIIRAKNGLEAINIAESEERIDCILMDIKMPEISGLEATKYIVRVRPEIPIIAQTAFALDGDKEKCMSAGCCAYITKPIEAEKLFNLMDKFFTTKNKVKIKHHSYRGNF